MKLRNYQTSVADEITEAFKTYRSVLSVLATGLGKTRIASEMIERFLPKRTLFLVGQRDLVDQGADGIREATQLECDIEMAERFAAASLFSRQTVVVSTIQTLISGEAEDGSGGRKTRFNPMDFGLVIFDEAHEILAESRQRVVKYFLDGNPNLKLLGLTATPQRTDERALGQVFETSTTPYELAQAIRDGWLVDIEQRIVAVNGLDFSHVRTTHGDLNGADLAAVMEQESVVMEIVMPTLEAMYDLPRETLRGIPIDGWLQRLTNGNAQPKRTIVFTVRVHHAEMLAAIFNRVLGDKAGCVSERSSKEDRRKTMEDFKDGKKSICCNVGILGQGYDNPAVGLIVMARPTKSLLRYQQQLGRGTRALRGVLDGLDDGPNGSAERLAAIASSEKRKLIVLDFVGNRGRHVIVNSADVLAGNYDDEVIERAKKRTEKDGKAVMRELLEEEAAKLQAEREERRRQDAARKARLVGKASYTVAITNPFDLLGLEPVRERGWQTGKAVTEKMAAMLRNMGVDPATPYAQASQLIGEQFRRWKLKLCTIKQAKHLAKHGINTKDLLFTDAGKMMDALAKNGWKNPGNLESYRTKNGEQQ